MAKQRHLSNAPITEALIDIQVAPQAGLTFAQLRDALGSPDFGYHVRGPIAQGVFEFKVTPDGEHPETTSESSQVGLRLHSTDEKYVAQCRLTGFTLSRLEPYQEWNELRDEVKRVWSRYVDRLAPVRVNRVAVRFINNLRLPLKQGDSFQTYLHGLADLPAGAPQALSSFFQRFDLRDVESGSQVILTATTERGSRNDHDDRVSLIMDIDAFATKDLAPSDSQLWDVTECLRGLKNRTFFSMITERTAELYE